MSFGSGSKLPAYREFEQGNAIFLSEPPGPYENCSSGCKLDALDHFNGREIKLWSSRGRNFPHTSYRLVTCLSPPSPCGTLQ